jgi:Fe-S cluster assembly iron-binding protein IscA
MLEVTDAAKGKIQEALKNNPGKSLRVILHGFGWGGSAKLGMVLDEPRGEEKSIPVNGLDILIDEDIKDFADRATIDYLKTPYGEGFSVDMAGASC